MKTWLWWSALFLAVMVISAEFGASGSTRFILEIVAGVVFVIGGLVVGVIRRLYLLDKERRERGDYPND